MYGELWYTHYYCSGCGPCDRHLCRRLCESSAGQGVPDFRPEEGAQNPDRKSRYQDSVFGEAGQTVSGADDGGH